MLDETSLNLKILSWQHFCRLAADFYFKNDAMLFGTL